MTDPIFTSSLAPAMNDFVALKRIAGYKYESGALRLGYFDRYLHEQSFVGMVLNNEILAGYTTYLLSTGPYNRYTQMVVARDFTNDYQRIEPKSAVIEANPFKRPRPTIPYIFTTDDISDLMQAASALKPAHSIKPYTFPTLIALLYVTGMRISEALHLTIKDFYQEPNRLFISKSKFDKDRWVVLRDSTACALRAHLEVCKSFAPQVPETPIFLNQKGTALSYSTAGEVFQALLKKCQIGSNWQGASPRLHGLRLSVFPRWCGSSERPGIRFPLPISIRSYPRQKGSLFPGSIPINRQGTI